MTQSANLRQGRPEDASAIRALYQIVAAVPGGIARAPEEVTEDYVEHFVAHSIERGVLLVAEAAGVPGLAGELHTYRSELQAFAHVLSELTVAVHPEAQGRGIGRLLFTRLIDLVTREHPDILRIELVAREGNTRALRLYEAVGFRREGRFEGRIRGPAGGIEADIPLAWYRRGVEKRDQSE